MGTTVIAEHTPFAVVFQTTDPVTGSVMQPNMSGEIPPYDVGRVELGALGTVVPTQEPDNLEPHSYSKGGHTSNPESGCQFNYAPASCQQLKNVLRALGVLFAGEHLIVDTYRERHVFARRPPRREPSAEWVAVNYLGSYWDRVGSEIINLPSGNASVSEFQNENQSKCDYRLARIFGGPDTVMATKWDLEGIRPAFRGMPERRALPYDREVGVKPIPGSEDPRAGTVHLYSNTDGTKVSVPNAFTPPGWTKVVSGKALTGNFLRFYYAPGSLAKYGYGGGLTVNFTHIGPADSEGVPLIPAKNGPENAMGSTQVGVLGGGPGTDPAITKGSIDYWVHSHMIFNVWDGKNSAINNRTRVDPRGVFCKDLGF